VQPIINCDISASLIERRWSFVKPFTSLSNRIDISIKPEGEEKDETQ
jgi:hypothetical protein